jgi:hypothetical protein
VKEYPIEPWPRDFLLIDQYGFRTNENATAETRDLLAVVGGNEVTNPFMVTEVYVQENGWKLASLSFTRLLTPEERH